MKIKRNNLVVSSRTKEIFPFCCVNSSQATLTGHFKDDSCFVLDFSLSLHCLRVKFSAFKKYDDNIH